MAKANPASEQLISQLRIRCEEARRAGSSTYLGIYNTGLFVALLNRDITTYNESVFFARSEWHRQFHARNLAVLLYEATEDLPVLLGKSFRSWLIDLELDQPWLDSLGKITGQISAFKRNHSSFLKDVRNYVGAHREHDALSQLSMLDNLDHLTVYQLAGDLSMPLIELANFYVSLLTYMHNPSVMLKQACKIVDRA